MYYPRMNRQHCGLKAAWRTQHSPEGGLQHACCDMMDRESEACSEMRKCIVPVRGYIKMNKTKYHQCNKGGKVGAQKSFIHNF